MTNLILFIFSCVFYASLPAQGFSPYHKRIYTPLMLAQATDEALNLKPTGLSSPQKTSCKKPCVQKKPCKPTAAKKTVIANEQPTKSTTVSPNVHIIRTATTKILTLAKTFDIALRNRPSLKALQFNTDAQMAAQRKTLSAYLPQVKFQTQGFVEKGTEGIHNLSTFSANQLVYSFANPFDLYRIAQKDTEAAKWAEAAHQDLIRNEVETTFLQSWLLQKQQAQVISRSVSARVTFERDKKSRQVDLLDRNDWLKKNVTYTQTITDASLYEENMNIAQSALERVIAQRLPGTVNKYEQSKSKQMFIALEWEPHRQIKLLPLEEYLTLSHQNRKEIKIKQKEVEREYETKKYQLKNYLPSISAFGSLSRGDQTVDFNVPGSTISEQAGLSLSWNIFDGLSSYRDYQAANARMMRASMEKQSLIEQIDQDVETAYLQTQQQLRVLKSAYASFVQAQNEYELNKQQYLIGLVALPELDAAIFTRENAYYAWISQRITAELKLRTLWYTCGYPAEFSI